MTSKRTIDRRLTRLEARRAARSRRIDPAEHEIDAEVIDAIIAASHHQLAAPTTPLPEEIITALPAALRAWYEPSD